MPLRCVPCSVIWNALNDANGEVRHCRGFHTLGRTVSSLKKALEEDPNLPELQVQDDFMIRQWYPDTFPTVVPGNAPPTTQSNDARLDSIESTMKSMQAVLETLVAERYQVTPNPRAATPRGTSRGRSHSPPAKRSRRQSRRDSYESSYSTSSDESPRSRSTSREGHAPEPEDDTTPKRSTEAPPANKGWQPVPTDWHVEETANAISAKVDKRDVTGRMVKEQVANVEFYAHRLNGGGTAYSFRNLFRETTAGPSPRSHARNLHLSLSNLATRVLGSTTAGPTIHLAKSDNKWGKITVDNFSASPLLKLDSLKTLWAARTAGAKSKSPIDEDDDLPTISINWPADSDERKTTEFLQKTSKLNLIPPPQLKKPDNNIIQTDNQLRAQANRTFVTSSALDIIAATIKAAETRNSWSTQDYQTFLATLRDAVEGTAATLAPRTRDDIRAAVTARIDLRAASIPKEYKAYKCQLLNLDPLSPCPYGTLEGVTEIIDSIPAPTVIDLKGYAPIKGNASRQNSGPSSSSPHGSQQGGKRGPFPSNSNKGPSSSKNHSGDNKKSSHHSGHGHSSRGGKGGAGKGGKNNPSPSTSTPQHHHHKH